jgi:predicted acylesterase/phospholipase RssA
MAEPLYDTICLSGGGLKGFCFIGVLDYMTSNHHIDLRKIKKLVGTSAGAIICYLLSINYTVQEIKEFLLGFNFSKILIDIDLTPLLENHGLDNGDKFVFIFRNFLKEKYDIDDITFEDHYKLTKKNLTMIGTNYTKSCETVFNHMLTPKMSVITALRISMSIPLLFTPVKHEDCYYIDGAFTNNFPINYCNPNSTLGIYVNYCKENTLNNFMSMTLNCLYILGDVVTKKYCNDKYNIIEIMDCLDTNIMIDFNLNMETKETFINIGVEAAKKYITNKKCSKSCDKSVQTDDIIKED